MLSPRLRIVAVFAIASIGVPASLLAQRLDLIDTFPAPNVCQQKNACELDKTPVAAQMTQLEHGFVHDGANWEPRFLGEFGGGAARPGRPKAIPMIALGAAAAATGECCPLCQGQLPQSLEANLPPHGETAEPELRPGEPAKVILETMKQVRPSVLDGTVFLDARPIGESNSRPASRFDPTAIMVHCIRTLDAQASSDRKPERSLVPTSTTSPLAAPASAATAADVVPLRQAGRELESTANMLEERGLYDQADHLRALAQELRLQARAATSPPAAASVAGTATPTSCTAGCDCDLDCE